MLIGLILESDGVVDLLQYNSNSVLFPTSSSGQGKNRLFKTPSNQRFRVKDAGECFRCPKYFKEIVAFVLRRSLERKA